MKASNVEAVIWRLPWNGHRYHYGEQNLRVRKKSAGALASITEQLPSMRSKVAAGKLEEELIP